ncbi:hypothetical protein [Nostoc sp.]
MAKASKLVLTKTFVNVLTESDLSFNLFFKGQSDRFDPLDVIKQL